MSKSVRIISLIIQPCVGQDAVVIENYFTVLSKFYEADRYCEINFLYLLN